MTHVNSNSLIQLGVNIIPVLPDYGYVTCIGDKNCLAQYEINDDGVTVKQTEILKSKIKINLFYSWSILRWNYVKRKLKNILFGK